MKLDEMDKLQKEFFVNVRAVQPAILVRTSEPHDAMASMLEVAEKKEWIVWVWDAKNGRRTPEGKPLPDGGAKPAAGVSGLGNIAASPQPMATLLASLDQLMVAPNFVGDTKDSGRKPLVLFLLNGHRFLDPHRQADMLVQALQQIAEDGKEGAKHVILVSPKGTTLPAELDPLFTIIDHARPGESELYDALGHVLPDGGELAVTDKERAGVVEAGKGMTRFQFEAAVSRCLVENKSVLTADYVWQSKVDLINRSPALELYRGKETFDDLGGLTGLKAFSLKTFSRSRSKTLVKEARPKGMLLLGPPGTGKSAFAKALGNMIGWPTLLFDVGALKGSLLGQTEERVREVLEIADTMGRVILFIDEVEKGLAGAGHDSQTSGGVMTGVLGTILTWQSDHTSEAYLICTSNDSSKLPTPFTRAERMDGIFYLDLPGPAQKQSIWQIYLQKFELDEQDLPDDANWTGAEIRSCCRLSALLDVPLKEGAKYVVPVYNRNRNEIMALKEYAKESCLDAESGKRFDAEASHSEATSGLGRVRKARRTISSKEIV